MITHIYKLKFMKSSFDLNDDYERLSDHEKERISDLDADTYFDYDDDDSCYICYVVTQPQEVERYLKILKNNFIQYKCDDISEDVLRSRINLSKELKPMTTATTSIKYSFFIDDIDDWIFNNLEIDIVLDRISEVSMKSLTNTEKEFLKNYQK